MKINFLKIEMDGIIYYINKEYKNSIVHNKLMLTQMSDFVIEKRTNSFLKNRENIENVVDYFVNIIN